MEFVKYSFTGPLTANKWAHKLWKQQQGLINLNHLVGLTAPAVLLVAATKGAVTY